MTNKLPPATLEPLTRADMRSERISDAQGFDKLELVTRRLLLLMGSATLAIGVHHWLTGLG